MKIPTVSIATIVYLGAANPAAALITNSEIANLAGPDGRTWEILAESASGLAGAGVMILIAVVFVFMGIGMLRSKHREKRLARLADSMGYRYVPERDKTRMGHRFDHIHQFGNNKGTTSNHLIGRVGDWGVVVCDHSYYSRYGRNRRSRNYGAVLIQIPLRMTEVIIEPKSLADRIVGILGVKYVDFESRKFSRRFGVRAKDAGFAYDVIHPEAMKFLLRHRKYCWELDGYTVALYREKCFKPGEVRKAIDIASGLIKLIPRHVWDSQREEAVEEGARKERDRQRQRAVGAAAVERQPDLAYRRVKRARFLAPITLLVGLSQIWAAVKVSAETPDASNLFPRLLRGAFGCVFILLFRKIYRRLRAFSRQRQAAADCARAMFEECGRIDTSELARQTGCVDEALARIHIQWAQRKGLVPSNAKVFSSGATAVEGTCPKCDSVWEFSSLDCGKKTDCPHCTAKFTVPESAADARHVEACAVS